MIPIELINEKFAEIIRKKGIAEKTGLPQHYFRQYRYMHKQGRISLAKQIKVLKMAGVNLQETHRYEHKDLVELLNYYQRCSLAARQMGNEYIVEKFINKDRKIGGKAKL